MNSYNNTELLEQLCFYKQCYGLYLAYHGDYNIPHEELHEELQKAAPYLSKNDIIQLLFNEHVYFTGGKEEIITAYLETVGDEGPTKFNSYDGPCKIYALLVNKRGEATNENT